MKIGARHITAPARARFAPDGNYDGADLRAAPVRPNALVATKLPSMIAGQRVYPDQPRTEWRIPPAAKPAPVAAMPAPLPSRPPVADPALLPYTPRPGGVIARIVAHLHAAGGYLTYRSVSHDFGVAADSISGHLTPALRTGLLVRIDTDEGRAVRLHNQWTPDAAPLRKPKPATTAATPVAPSSLPGLAELAELMNQAAGQMLSMTAALERVALLMQQMPPQHTSIHGAN